MIFFSNIFLASRLGCNNFFPSEMMRSVTFWSIWKIVPGSLFTSVPYKFSITSSTHNCNFRFLDEKKFVIKFQAVRFVLKFWRHVRFERATERCTALFRFGNLLLSSSQASNLPPIFVLTEFSSVAFPKTFVGTVIWNRRNSILHRLQFCGVICEYSLELCRWKKCSKRSTLVGRVQQKSYPRFIKLSKISLLRFN